ncbi:hypothetical protein [Streptomyces armeniacus]|uniref:hypothetical protein n=1 Tax=Streptomyces armeniacus TaxID=83291 RepID=UPI001FE9E620|nr:hypothetical protein [Streptomyces armeniacus]
MDSSRTESPTEAPRTESRDGSRTDAPGTRAAFRDKPPFRDDLFRDGPPLRDESAEPPPPPPRAADRLPDGPAVPPRRTTRRPPQPAMPPQPPPPTGEPITGPRRTGSVPSTGTGGGADDDGGPPTFRLRPVPADGHARPPLRTIAAVACLVLGTGLLGGVGTGIWFTDDADAKPAAEAEFDTSRQLWHNVPVDSLFPRTLKGDGAGPGGADRTWTRVAVAPDTDCRNAFDALLGKALAPAGCHRLVRATYADETSSSVTTVGIVFTKADEDGMRKLRDRFAADKLGERTDLMPRAYPARGTVAADFADPQRASWTVSVLTDAPAVVYAVSGFADGRTVSEPQPAADATARGQTSAAAQAGLGHDAQSIAARVERGLRAELPGSKDPEKAS